MRVTVEIEEDDLREIQAATGEAKKSPAIHKALTNYLRERRMHAFLEKIRRGQTDYPLTNDELEAQFAVDPDRHLRLD